MAKRIALVEDEAAIRENYAAAVRKRGYEVVTYPDKEAALAGFKQRLPDLALIDIGLGDDIEGGFDLCRELRGMSATVPVIFLTARDSDLDEISGLRLGADDYLTKDVSVHQILARVAALFRRVEAMEKQSIKEDVISTGDLVIDRNRMLVSWRQETVDLTLTEFWMVYSLAKIPGHVKSREQLMQDANIFVDDGTVTSHIKRIRRKFAMLDSSFECIDTVYGMGYRWKS